jgi:predicted  nucleic acid-binding Zn-ribbon protein
MSELPKLIINAETSAHAVKAAADTFVGWLKSIQADVQRCEADLEQKRRAADTEIARKRAQIEELTKEYAALERSYSELHAKVERERKEIGAERDRLRRTVDQVLAA